MKGGGAPCDDDFLSGRRDLLLDLFGDDLFYTPGDNDWTDCDREDAGSFDELERLDKIRSLFFSQNLPSNPEWRIDRQVPDYPENASWTYGNLQFVTLHIVGTDNGRDPICSAQVPGRVLRQVLPKGIIIVIALARRFERFNDGPLASFPPVVASHDGLNRQHAAFLAFSCSQERE